MKIPADEHTARYLTSMRDVKRKRVCNRCLTAYLLTFLSGVPLVLLAPKLYPIALVSWTVLFAGGLDLIPFITEIRDWVVGKRYIGDEQELDVTEKELNGIGRNSWYVKHRMWWWGWIIVGSLMACIAASKGAEKWPDRRWLLSMSSMLVAMAPLALFTYLRDAAGRKYKEMMIAGTMPSFRGRSK